MIEFPQPFAAPPVVIATARSGGAARRTATTNHSTLRSLQPAAPPLSFALTFSKVTAEYAVMNVYSLGEPGAWTELLHVDWRAWASGGGASSSSSSSSTSAAGGARGCEVGVVRMEEPEGVVALSRHFRAEPIVLASVLNDLDAASSVASPVSAAAAAAGAATAGGMRMRGAGAAAAAGGGGAGGWARPSRGSGGARAPKAWDTYVATLHNISSGRFAASLSKVYQTQIWKDGVVLGYVAQNATRVCLDDCLGHGTCVDGRCQCDPGWRGNGTCDTCAEGYWGEACTACPALNASTGTGTGLACSGHGACDGGGTTGGTGACLCEVGYAGAACEACAAGWFPDYDAGPALCSLCPRAGNATCAGHGSCREVLHRNNRASAGGGGGGGGDARACVCDGAWAGPYCAECARGYGGEDCDVPCPGLCAGRGDCRLDGDGDGVGGNVGGQASSSPHCVCDPGWDDASMCQSCAQGFFGPGCAGRCPDCGANGACQDGLSGSGECACGPGYTPESLCRACALGYFPFPDAGQGGNGVVCAECPGGAASPCSGHSDPPGQCPDGLCVCTGGYHGEDCSAIDKDRGWAVILVIVLAGALFLGLAALAARGYWAARHGGDDGLGGGGGKGKDRRRWVGG